MGFHDHQLPISGLGFHLSLLASCTATTFRYPLLSAFESSHIDLQELLLAGNRRTAVDTVSSLEAVIIY
jgi:hypothetical protein